MNLEKIVGGATAFMIGAFAMAFAQDQFAKGIDLQPWQTIATGILAIIAALLTVNQMRSIEDRQQKRHNDLMLLNMRADQLRIQRVVDKCDMLAELAEDGPERFSAYRLHEPDNQREYGFYLDAKLWVESLGNVFRHRTVADALGLFDVHTTWTYDRFEEFLVEAESIISKADGLISRGDDDWRKIVRTADYVFDELYVSATEFVDSLASLRKDYQ